MEKWQENILKLDESLKDIIDKINSGYLVYSESKSVDGECTFKTWKDCNENIICVIRDDYEANLYRYDDNGNEIYNRHLYSINDIYIHNSYTVISSYDAMNNNTYTKIIYSSGNISETKSIYNKNNKLIMRHYIKPDRTNTYYFADENGKHIWVSGYSGKKVAKYSAFLNKDKTGYKKYRFFGYDIKKFDNNWKKVYPKYKIKNIQKKTKFISSIREKE